MTRKDYIKMAEVISHRRGEIATGTDPELNRVTDCIALDMCNMLSADNSRFDRERFMEACGRRSDVIPQ